jgi:hypothetical protein
MVSTVTRSHSSDVLANLSAAQASPSTSTSSFTDQLAAALEGYLAQSGDGSHLEIDIQASPSQNSGVRQFVVTVKNPGTSAPAQAATAVSSAANSSAPATTQPSDPVDEATRADQIRAEIDAYWKAQPTAVQQLRNVADFGQRNVLAQQLADQGYTIDRAIMVWGWDPLKTMLTRKMYGYNWVPNMNQPNVTSPGMALPGQTPYDGSNAPAGSIAVNTDFANGLNISDPWA